MSYISWFAKRVLRRWAGRVSPEKAKVFMDLSRVTYALGACGLLVLVLRARRDFEKQQQLLGKPVMATEELSIKDFIKGARTKEEMDELERKAYDRAYQAQKAELEAGGKLPLGALNLVDDK